MENVPVGATTESWIVLLSQLLRHGLVNIDIDW